MGRRSARKLPGSRLVWFLSPLEMICVSSFSFLHLFEEKRERQGIGARLGASFYFPTLLLLLPRAGEDFDGLPLLYLLDGTTRSRRGSRPSVPFVLASLPLCNDRLN